MDFHSLMTTKLTQCFGASIPSSLLETHEWEWFLPDIQRAYLNFKACALGRNNEDLEDINMFLGSAAGPFTKVIFSHDDNNVLTIMYEKVDLKLKVLESNHPGETRTQTMQVNSLQTALDYLNLGRTIPVGENPIDVLIFADQLPMFKQDLVTQTKLRDLMRSLQQGSNPVLTRLVITGINGKLPDMFTGLYQMIEAPVPDKAVIRGMLEDAHIPGSKETDTAESKATFRQLQQVIRTTSFRQACIYAQLAGSRSDDPKRMIEEATNDMIRQMRATTPWLDFIPTVTAPPPVCGMENLKDYLMVQKAVREFGDPSIPTAIPLGLIGPPGTGKSMCFQYISHTLSLPIIMLSIGSMLGSLVGETDEKFRQFRRLLESNPSVLLCIDEIEKTAPNMNGGASDAGTSSRLMSNLMMLISESTEQGWPIQIVVAGNTTYMGNLPPEFYQRFQIYQTTRPNRVRMGQIFAAHLAKISKKEYDTDCLALELNRALTKYDDIDPTRDNSPVGRDIKYVIDASQREAVARTMKSGVPDMVDLLKAIAERGRANKKAIGAASGGTQITAIPVDRDDDETFAVAPQAKRQGPVKIQPQLSML